MLNFLIGNADGNPEIISNGIPIDLFAKMCKKLDAAGIKTQDTLNGYVIAFVEDAKTATNDFPVQPLRLNRDYMVVFLRPDTPVHIETKHGHFYAVAQRRLEGITLGKEPIPLDPTEKTALDEWYEAGDTGSSSLLLAQVLLGGTPCPADRQDAYPHDAGDFGRCRRLAAKFPEINERIAEMGAHGAIWTNLANKWADMTKAYDAGDREECGRLLRSATGRPTTKPAP